MKKTFPILLLFFFMTKAFVGLGNKNINLIPEEKEVPPASDTVPYSIIIVDEEEEIIDYTDPLMSLPSNDLFCDWDTINIRPFHFNVSSYNDTTKISLCPTFSCGYMHPFPGNVTSNFGPRKKRFHYGIDIDLETGDSVGAAFDGKVRIVKKSKSYGNLVVIRHKNGLETFYAHLSKINVETGQDVFAGDIIGLGGNTGHSHGSHLHFEVRYMGQPINPNSIISFSEHKLITDEFLIDKETFSYTAVASKIAQASKHKGNSKTYIVKKGDTLSTIARKYGIATQVIRKKNGLKSNDYLRYGQKIKI